jgi:alkylation response protein AidB-like acyl-CoA dehydrogenase
MDFGLSQEQRLLEQSLKRFLADRVPMEERRRIAEIGTGFDEALWGELTEMGVPGLLVPESFGGLGLTILDATVVAEVLGYAATPAPFAGSAVMAPLALQRAGTDAQRAAFLPATATGEARFAVAFGDLAGEVDGTPVALTGKSLSGRIQGAMDAGGATHLLIWLPGAVALVAVDAPGVEVVVRPSLDRTRPLADVVLQDAEAELLDPDRSRDTALEVLDAGRIMLAADALGAGQRMLDEAVPYACERVQFGRPVGSFQAVKHMCAEMVAMLEPCRSLIWYAAYAQDNDRDDRRTAACHAKAHLAEVGRDVSRTATEVHGGMGYTDLLGLHFWFKRIAFDRQVLGGPEQCREEAAVAQGWGAA